MLPIDGFLRDSVLVESTPTGVELRFSVWSIELPSALLDSSKKIAAFFRRELSSSALESECDNVRNLVSVLSHQGCLIPEYHKEAYRLSEVKSLYISFCNESYGRYYAHSLWKAMRADKIPVSIIRQWISRTYFLSRFAGVTASAASRSGPTSEIKFAFLKSAVEEYSHCEDYYLPPAALFPPDLGYIKGIAPAPCFVAFDQQMLRIAKKDWLAHLFVALFQERTAQFREGAHRLYSRIEEQLGMPGLFSGWRTHISFDEENSHEGDLDSLFEQDIEVSYEQLQEAFDEACLTLDLLTDGLEEVLHLGNDGRNPRASASNNFLRSHQIEGIRCLSGISEYAIKATNPSDLVIELTGLIESTPSGLCFLSAAEAFFYRQMECFLVALSTECLENCVTHDEIIYVGKILETTLRGGLKYEPAPNALEKASRVVRNHLSCKARRPSEFTFVNLLLLRLLEAGSRKSSRSNGLEVISSITDSLTLATQKLCSPEMGVDYLNEALSSLSMLEYALALENSARQPIRFAMGHNTALQWTPASGRP
jgi:thiaminase